MNFLYPVFLFALISVAIPIIIHLFSFRRFQTVYFSHVGFLKNIKKESQKKSRLKHILILLARILTLIFLVLAFSQPYIPLDNSVKKQPNQIVAIYIDNSFSMNALSDAGQLLESARKKAVEICMTYPSGTKFALITNDLEARHRHFFNREQTVRLISEIQTSPVSVPISVVFKRLSLSFFDLQNKTDKNIYFISDFQKSITDLEKFSDPFINCYLLPLQPNQTNNLYIDSVWVEEPEHQLNQEENVFVKIKNYSGQDYQNLPLNLFINDTLKSITNFSVNARNEIITSLKYKNNTSGIKQGNIEISDYPFTHDNNWYFSYLVKPSVKVLAIYNGTTDSESDKKYIASLFKNDSYVLFDEMNLNNLQVSKLINYNTIIIVNPNELSTGFLIEIKKVIESGTSVVLFPQLKKDISAYNDFFNQFKLNRPISTDTSQMDISGIDFENPFYKNVFKKIEENAISPKIYGHLKFETNTRISENKLLWFRNGDKALSYSDFVKGKIWIFAFPLNTKNEKFAHDILFVPTLYNIIINSLAKQMNSYLIGRDNFYEITTKENKEITDNYEIRNPKTGEKVIPQKSILESVTKLNLTGLIREAGHYLVETENITHTSLAFNYDRKESELTYYNNDELKTNLAKANLASAKVLENSKQNFSEIFTELQNGKQLWKTCILLALLFIIAEVLIIRFWKS